MGRKPEIFLNCGLTSLINVNYKIQNNLINIYNFDDKFINLKDQKFYKRNFEKDRGPMRDVNRFEGSMKMRFI